MKFVAKSLLATMMIAGTISAIASPKTPKTSAPGFSDGGPAPLCYPTEPNCPPPVPK
jgi:hypothetical protein